MKNSLKSKERKSDLMFNSAKSINVVDFFRSDACLPDRLEFKPSCSTIKDVEGCDAVYHYEFLNTIDEVKFNNVIELQILTYTAHKHVIWFTWTESEII